MLRHIVFFSVPDAENTATVMDGLALLKQIPDKLLLEIEPNLQSDPIKGPVPDIIVYGEFTDEAQLKAFKAHPNYQRSIDIVRPLRELRIAADYLVPKS